MKNINRNIIKSPFIKGDVRPCLPAGGRTGGFTLFELLVSISIIGILVAVASTSYGAAQKKARDSRRVEDLNNIQKALEQYYSVNNYVYPSMSGGTPVGLGSTFIQGWPKDPKAGTYLYSVNVPYGLGSYCVSATLDNPVGNCTNTACGGIGTVTNGLYYCVASQQ